MSSEELLKDFYSMTLASQDKTIWTIGHSNLPLDGFLSLLTAFSIQVVADIRRLPGSRKYPWYNQAELSLSLQRHGIRYVHFPGLGGRRTRLPDSKNTAWRNKSFMGYADYMETKEFRQAIGQLEEIASGERLAYMCAEAVWWRCHRALVSDYLKVHGWRSSIYWVKVKELNILIHLWLNDPNLFRLQNFNGLPVLPPTGERGKDGADKCEGYEERINKKKALIEYLLCGGVFPLTPESLHCYSVFFPIRQFVFPIGALQLFAAS